MNQILDKAYQGLVDKASPTGLLPIWNKWVDKKVVAKYGFSYNLTGQGNPRSGRLQGHGRRRYVENKDGSDISLKIQCPNGWSDWMTSIQVIAESAKAAGIKITPGYPDYGTLVDDRGHARYDLVLANDRQYSNTPWTYYQYIFQLPILDNQTTVNYERFTSPKAWAHATAGQDTHHHEGLPGSHVEAADDVPAESACYSALVQRNVGHVQHDVLDELAVGHGRKYTPHRLEQLLADDEHRHAHASEAGQRQLGREHDQ